MFELSFVSSCETLRDTFLSSSTLGSVLAIDLLLLLFFLFLVEPVPEIRDFCLEGSCKVGGLLGD